MSTPVFVFGAGPHGRVIREALVSSGRQVSGFIDDRQDLAGSEVDGLVVHDARDWLARTEPQHAALGIGSNVARLAVLDRLCASGHIVASAVHATAVVAAGVRLGEGAFVAMLAGIGVGCIVAPGVVINTAVTLDHDGVIEKGVYLSPGVCCAGRVRVGARAFVGAGAIIGPGVHIGHDAVVGAGSVVLNDLPPHSVSFGVPARPRRTQEPGAPLDWRRLLGGPDRREP